LALKSSGPDDVDFDFIFSMNLRLLVALLVPLGLWSAPAVTDEARWTEYIDAAGTALYRGDYAEAQKQTEAALKETAEFEEQDWRLMMTLNKLAGFYRVQGRYDEAAALYRRSLAIDEKTLGPKHPNVIAGVNDLAELYRAQGREDQAQRLLRAYR